MARVRRVKNVLTFGGVVVKGGLVTLPLTFGGAMLVRRTRLGPAGRAIAIGLPQAAVGLALGLSGYAPNVGAAMTLVGTGVVLSGIGVEVERQLYLRSSDADRHALGANEGANAAQLEGAEPSAGMEGGTGGSGVVEADWGDQRVYQYPR